MSTKTKVWTSEAWARSNYIKFVSFQDTPHSVEMSRKFRWGEFIDRNWFPKQIYPDYPSVRLSDVFTIQGFLVLVSERMVDLLERFDLGENQLVPTDLYDHTKKIKQTDRYFFLNITEKKAGCFDRESSKGRFLGDAEHGFLTATNAFGGIAVRETAVLGGVDLWMDPILGQTPFFSGPLGEAIKKTNYETTGLKPCNVLS